MQTRSSTYKVNPIFFAGAREKTDTGQKNRVNYYTYGMNGQEKDDEITGNSGTDYTAEHWEYDSRLGRRWNTDPVIASSTSPYAAFNNSPIKINDPTGAVSEDATGAKPLSSEDKQQINDAAEKQIQSLGKKHFADKVKDAIIKKSTTYESSQITYTRTYAPGGVDYTAGTTLSWDVPYYTETGGMITYDMGTSVPDQITVTDKATGTPIVSAPGTALSTGTVPLAASTGVDGYGLPTQSVLNINVAPTGGNSNYHVNVTEVQTRVFYETKSKLFGVITVHKEIGYESYVKSTQDIKVGSIDGIAIIPSNRIRNKYLAKYRSTPTTNF